MWKKLRRFSKWLLSKLADKYLKDENTKPIAKP